MLVDELLRVALSSRSEDGYRHAKELLPEIARMHRDDNEMEDLDGERCWPCRTSSYWRKFCSIGSFYVNDREDLFEIFSNTHTFLDFDFDTSRNLENILRNGGCDMFLSENVLIETESRKPLEYAHDLTQDFRGRADALVKYVIRPPIQRHAYYYLRY
jgi:hypothetical protein